MPLTISSHEQVVEKNDAVLNLSSEKEARIVTDYNHVDICRFWDPKNEMLQQILADIEEMADVAISSSNGE